MVGMGSHVSLDRQQDPHSRFLLPAGCLPAEVHPQTSSVGLARALHGAIAPGAAADPAVCSSLSSSRGEGAAARCHRAVQTDFPTPPKSRALLHLLVERPIPSKLPLANLASSRLDVPGAACRVRETLEERSAWVHWPQ